MKIDIIFFFFKNVIRPQFLTHPRTFIAEPRRVKSMAGPNTLSIFWFRPYTYNHVGFNPWFKPRRAET